MRSEAPCSMDLRKFPMDSIRCDLIFESYSYNAAEVTLDWLEWQPVTAVKSEFNLPDFKLINITYGKHTEVYTAGIWHRLSVEFYFDRLFGFYILQVKIEINWKFIMHHFIDVFANVCQCIYFLDSFLVSCF